MAEPRTERGLDRLVNFSDATVAIAITLLILPLVDVATETRDHDLGTVFHENLGALISFVVTFAVIGQFWTVHHRIFEYVRAYSPRLIAANFVWLAGIVFLPFAANVLSGSDGQPSISALYIGTMVVVTAAAFGIDLILIRHPELCHPESVGDLSLAPSLSFITLLVVAGVIAVVFPAINLYALLILFLGRETTKLYDRWLPRAAAVGRRAGDAKAEEGATSE
ncbi:TMEM175 family protein [Frondihabitans australicus]|uniref:Putative membrane protein n=1 Tax=Frondihabitans australicus TaxID=386892 RepID=A0A495IC74_9MICO|nr:TMEM175 family protein [Frondihabitans australicus]RKR73603.1 putative membrane protein [Frondihabitans australicus]